MSSVDLTSEGESADADVGVGDAAAVLDVDSARMERDAVERALLPDFTDAASDVSSPFPSRTELRGLSVLLLLAPGILLLSERKDRDDSLVSDLDMDGRLSEMLRSPEPAEPDALDDPPPPPPSLDVWFPML